MSLKGLSRIVVFGAEYCGFCKRAHTLLSKAKVQFDYMDVEEDNNMNLLHEFQKKYSYHKIPMIFVDERFIGGYS